MREIKFRAWDNEENRFFPIGKLIWGIKGLEAFREDGWTIDKIYSCVIEQYTGLHDKNGREIYEGDILRGDGDWVVIFEDSQWGLDCITFGSRHAWLSFCDCDISRCEVIGNIHENVELIK